MFNKKTNLFHIGPQKSGTTWLYQALKEHKDVSTSCKDTIHYFDMNYNKGMQWYHQHLQNGEKKVTFDPTYTYIRDKESPKRIYDYNPDAKIMFTARNPLERAFSHYWHEKKKDRFNFTFDEVFKNYDLYTNWVEPGMYAMHYNRYQEYFPKEQIKILFFDDLNDNPKKFFQEVCEFCEIDSSFTPSVLEKKVNATGTFKSFREREREKKLINIPFINLAVRAKNKFFTKGYKETLKAIDSKVKIELIDVFYSDICELEQITGRDLSKWKNKY